MRRAARAHPDRVLLIDWVAYSGAHGGWFGERRMHVNDTGARAFASLVAIAHARRSGRRGARCVSRAAVAGRRRAATVRRSRTRLRVHVIRGARRMTCRRARERSPAARRSQGVRGWRAYDWRDAAGPWQDVYARRDRKVIVATVRR